MQESRLVNIDYGDRDSIGLFQQRPSQGWGTVEQIMDPVYSTGKFFDHLVKVPGYEKLEVTDAAQAVQRSAYPQAYAQHEPRARAWASALTGYSTAALWCELRDATVPGDAVAVQARLTRDLGRLPTTVARSTDADDAPTTVTVDARPLGAKKDADRLGWAVGQWAVANADELSLDEVQVDDQLWTRSSTTWEPVPTKGDDARHAAPPGRVTLTLAR
ncbi:hypothetical protein [Cellulomonas sp. HZM]|uniref:hypothetical protein n=1 Tax=Cellulomonas sp. HZM TaxID=1454010 RepID=UPI000AD5657B|nr:hypothetical protein [Cellulomonas sp. HZM]